MQAVHLGNIDTYKGCFFPFYALNEVPKSHEHMTQNRRDVPRLYLFPACMRTATVFPFFSPPPERCIIEPPLTLQAMLKILVA